MLLAWSNTVSIKRIWSNEYCIELHVEYENSKDNFVAVFVHANTEVKERQLQWEELKNRKHLWGEKWVIGGDFNNIKGYEEKEGGRKRAESSFMDFRRFISEMEMGDFKFQGNTFT